MDWIDKETDLNFLYKCQRVYSKTYNNLKNQPHQKKLARHIYNQLIRIDNRIDILERIQNL